MNYSDECFACMNSYESTEFSRLITKFRNSSNQKKKKMTAWAGKYLSEVGVSKNPHLIEFLEQNRKLNKSQLDDGSTSCFFVTRIAFYSIRSSHCNALLTVSHDSWISRLNRKNGTIFNFTWNRQKMEHVKKWIEKCFTACFQQQKLKPSTIQATRL